MHIQSRAMTSEERAWLAGLRGKMPSRWKEGIENFIVLLSATSLAAFILGALVVWLLRKMFSIELGSGVILVLVLLTICGCALYAAVSTVQWLRGWKNDEPLIVKDLSKGLVIEEGYVFTEAKRFQEPEYGGLVYCLRTTEDEVFVVYDQESQELGVDGREPLESTFRPCSNLLLVRSPLSNLVISKRFSGSVLDVGDVKDLNLPPDKWPEQDAVSDVLWSELERTLAHA